LGRQTAGVGVMISRASLDMTELRATGDPVEPKLMRS
jgi:hypothetical protein